MKAMSSFRAALQRGTRADIMNFERRKLFEIILLAAVLVVSFNQVYRVHYGYTGLVQNPHNSPNYITVTDFNYPYPIHADEWAHLAQTVYIMQSGTLGFVNPYSPELEYHNDLELGYHLFLAAFFSISGLDPVLGYQYLPALFFTVNSLFLFLFVKRFTGNYYMALLSILFFLAVPSNTNIMGNWFAIPLTFSLFMVYAFFMLFGEFMERGKRTYLFFSAAVYCLSAVTYPLAAILISIMVMVQLLLRIRVRKKGFLRNNMLPISGSGLMAMVLLLILVNFPGYSVLSLEWTSFQYDYSLIFFYGIIPTSLAVIGALVAVDRKMNNVFIIWPAVFLLNLFSYMVTGTGLFFAYERSIYYLLVGFAPLAAIGLFHVIEKLYHTSGNLPLRYRNYIVPSLAILLVLVIFTVIFQGYYEIGEKDLVLLHVLEKQDYEAMKFIGESYGSGNVVLADSLLSIGTYPISRSHAVAIMPSNLAYGDTSIFTGFAASACSEKLRIADNENVDFVLSVFPIDCGFLEEVYRDGDYVYRVRK